MQWLIAAYVLGWIALMFVKPPLWVRESARYGPLYPFAMSALWNGVWALIFFA